MKCCLRSHILSSRAACCCCCCCCSCCCCCCRRCCCCCRRCCFCFCYCFNICTALNSFSSHRPFFYYSPSWLINRPLARPPPPLPPPPPPPPPIRLGIQRSACCLKGLRWSPSVSPPPQHFSRSAALSPKTLPYSPFLRSEPPTFASSWEGGGVGVRGGGLGGGRGGWLIMLQR
jgi:hypothetical protein